MHKVDWSLKTAQMCAEGIEHLLDRNRSVGQIATLLEKKSRRRVNPFCAADRNKT